VRIPAWPGQGTTQRPAKGANPPCSNTLDLPTVSIPVGAKTTGCLLFPTSGSASPTRFQLALETVESLFREGATSLTEQVREANRAVFARSQEDRNVSGMGTTLTAAKIEGGAVRLAHVGDSRAYLLRGQRLVQLTRDDRLTPEVLRESWSAAVAQLSPTP